MRIAVAIAVCGIVLAAWAELARAEQPSRCDCRYQKALSTSTTNVCTVAEDIAADCSLRWAPPRGASVQAYVPAHLPLEGMATDVRATGIGGAIGDLSEPAFWADPLELATSASELGGNAGPADQFGAFISEKDRIARQPLQAFAAAQEVLMSDEESLIEEIRAAIKRVNRLGWNNYICAYLVAVLAVLGSIVATILSAIKFDPSWKTAAFAAIPAATISVSTTFQFEQKAIWHWTTEKRFEALIRKIQYENVEKAKVSEEFSRIATETFIGWSVYSSLSAAGGGGDGRDLDRPPGN